MNNNSKIEEAFYRAGRTFGQAFIGTLLALLLTGQFTSKVGDATVPNIDNIPTLLAAAGLSGFIALMSWVQNALGK